MAPARRSARRDGSRVVDRNVTDERYAGYVEWRIESQGLPSGKRARRNGIVLAAFVLVVVACSGNGQSPEAYFDGLNAETERYNEAVDELRIAYGDELETALMNLQERADFSDTSSVDAYFDQAKEVAIVKTAELFSNSGGELRDFLDLLKDMTPPDPFVVVHQDAVAAGEALAASMPLTIEAVRSLGAIEDLDETLLDTPYSVATQRFNIACQNLQDAARAEAIEVEINCPVGPAAVARG